VSSAGVEADYLELVTRDAALVLLNRSPEGLDYWMNEILMLISTEK
jgi:conjugal transfer pilus assembly protein TraE